MVVANMSANPSQLPQIKKIVAKRGIVKKINLAVKKENARKGKIAVNPKKLYHEKAHTYLLDMGIGDFSSRRSNEIRQFTGKWTDLRTLCEINLYQFKQSSFC
jgi:hypothetical protein